MTVETNDPFTTHEALHIASFRMRSVDAELLEHPAVRANEAWTELASRAHQALFDLYQSIGAAYPGPGERTEGIGFEREDFVERQANETGALTFPRRSPPAKR